MKEQKTKTKNKSFLVRTLKLFRPFWKSLTVVTSLLLIGQILSILSPYLYGKAVDAVLHHDLHVLLLMLGGAFGLTLLQGQFLTWYREAFEVKHLDEYTDHHLSSVALEKMFSFSVGQHVNEHSGVRLSIVTRGQNALNDLMNNVLYTIVPNSLQIIVIFALLAWIAWPVAAVGGVFVVLFILITYRQNKVFSPMIRELGKKRQAQSRLQSEFFHNSILVIAESQEKKAEGEFEASGETFIGHAKKVWLKFLNAFYASRPLLTIGQYASLTVGVYLIFEGHLATGMFVTLFSWTSSVFGNLQQIMSMQRRMLGQVADIKKMYDLFDIATDVPMNEGGVKIDSLNGSIEFKDVSFAYPYRSSVAEEDREDDAAPVKSEDYVTRGVSMLIPAGAKVGFVGSSGSGKSTVVNLMRRYYDPTKGTILVDGVDLKTLDLGWFRSQIGNVEQKIELFDRSIRDNILFGLPEGATISDQELARVIKDASLDDFVSKLPEGLDTHIGENGVKVSGGERQRIGIARAFIKNPKILIFDEATSALDSVNEKLIHEAINRGAEGRTTIIIAHRLSTVRDADIIFVMSHGKITASGKHDDLQKTSPDYQNLIRNQLLAG